MAERVLLTDTPVYRQLHPDSPLLANLNRPGTMPAGFAIAFVWLATTGMAIEAPASTWSLLPQPADVRLAPSGVVKIVNGALVAVATFILLNEQFAQLDVAAGLLVATVAWFLHEGLERRILTGAEKDALKFVRFPGTTGQPDYQVDNTGA